MENIIEKDTISTGIVYVKDNCIIYAPHRGKLATIPMNNIAIIAEYTINDHPLHKNQWYLVFVSPDGSWQSIPWFSQNIQQLSDYLAYHFKTSFSLSDLTSTIRAKSLIRYPECLHGKPLFHFIPPAGYKTPLSRWQKFKNLLRIGNYNKKWQIEFSDEVRSFLEH